jgi:hypothetical protein
MPRGRDHERIAALGGRRLRASRTFTLLGLDELPPREQEELGSLRTDRDFYGVLKPQDPLRPSKSVSKEAALLFLALTEPRRIPALLESIFGDDPDPLLGLFADGVLEIEHEGAFVSGTEALRLLRPPAIHGPPQHPLHRLSRAAIEFAAEYEGLDAAMLTEKLYAFGRTACTPALRQRFAKDGDLLSWLASDPGVSDLLSSGWALEHTEDSPWLMWSSRGSVRRLGYKLYVSARVDSMPRLFGMTVRAMKRRGCDHFKLGRLAEGVCRPDKMVLYFATLDHLRECAGHVESELRASELPRAVAHGVPFTAAIDPAGFLSWGMDPPELGHVTDAFRRQSFRQWVASRVAVAVLSAKGASSKPADIVDVVLERVELDGIDPITWAPELALWRHHAASAEDVA